MQGLEIALQLPDLWQQDAVRALGAGRDVVVDAPTGAGKTWVFELHEKARKGKGGQSVFTVPTRALANDKWREWKADGWQVGIATGDRAENLDAPVLVATLETQRERILSGDPGLGLLAIDEYQMIADPARGSNYELTVALAGAQTQLLLLSGSVENPDEVIEWLGRLGRDAVLVRTPDRPVPLEEMPVEELPRLPEKTGAFWPRVAAGACLSDLAPLLLFAPRREAAENLARKVAAAFPDDDPIELPGELAGRAGKGMCKLLRSRVAYHHSGLDYETRAGVVEPLAKAGQLRVIVATTGLAAGINFSVRSVAVTETTYREGAYLRELRPDELLQMFGRAGRRGLDEIGYVVTARKTPRLFDAAPLRLRRATPIDWPSLLRVMAHASDEGSEPFAAAAETCGRLFSRQKLLLGVEPEAVESQPAKTFEQGPGLDGPRRQEMQTPDGEWEALSDSEESEAAIGQCWVHEDGGWVRAIDSESFVTSLGRGRPCRVGDGLGLEVKVARLKRPEVKGEPRPVAPLGWVKAKLDAGSLGKMTRPEFEALVIPELAGEFEVGRFHRLVRRGGMLAAQLDLSAVTAVGRLDSTGRVLIDPPSRSVAVEVDTGYQTGGAAVDPPPGTAAHAWRKLGLVDAQGRPTSRGRTASRFQGGEGLVVAAALEDEDYPVSELAWHLANLRGGYRFRETEGGGSSRLAVVTREAYGMVDHPGYLELGLPPGYGEGTAEVLEEVLLSKGGHDEALSSGDVERAKVEWLSLLRHVAGTSGVGGERWEALVAEAEGLLARFAKAEVEPDLGIGEMARTMRRPRHLRRSDFPR